jgi:DNA-binding GntR family transcriptional regulator
MKAEIIIGKNVSLYYKVYSELRKRLESGEYAKGTLLPTEAELQEQFHVSRVTIRKAVELLSSEGYVVSQQGRGTKVLDHKISQKLNYASSFTETLLERGVYVSSSNVSIDLVAPSARVAADLGISPETKIVRLYRIRLANNRPIAISINYLKSSIAQGICERFKGNESLYQLLENEYGVSIDNAVESISARAAGVTEAELLQVPVGAPLLTSYRVTYSKGEPFEVVVSSVVADMHEYTIYLKGRSNKN